MFNVLAASPGEQAALFRLGVVGDLVARDLDRGELEAELRERARKRYRPPGAASSRSYHWKTLQAWYYKAKKGVETLKAASRKRGVALTLSEAQREVVRDMRAENPSAAADLILEEAVRNGVIEDGKVSVETVRRLLRDADLPRASKNRKERRAGRRRWRARRVCSVWHADVCHIWLRTPDGKPYKAYVHCFLDDHSRYILALEARLSERELDAVSVLCIALLRFPAPDVLYLDNGSCYSGELLALVCQRLGIRLVHASPRDPEARGKQERFFRTMRQRCTDHLGPLATLHDLNVALLAFLDADYHRRPHGGLMGGTPLRCFQEGVRDLPTPRTAVELAEALEVVVKCTVRKDATFQLHGQLWEVAGRHLAGKRIAIRVDPFTDRPLSASWRNSPVVFGPCDPLHNAQRGRPDDQDAPRSTTPFDPIAALLSKARKEIS